MIGKESGQGIYFPENHPKVDESLATDQRIKVRSCLIIRQKEARARTSHLKNLLTD